MVVSVYRKRTIKSKVQAAGVFEVLVKKLLDADKRGFSIQPRFLREITQSLLREHTQGPTAVLTYCILAKLTMEIALLSEQRVLSTYINRSP
jgi:hypothetical protein